VLLGEIVEDLDIRGVAVGFTVAVCVFDIELEPDTEFVELKLITEL
jgi:hypothetical protein